ncbi:3-oxoacyl-ACP synthase [Polaribacter vadi]|uniref:3-oxoacyl-ACP synthase n=1 Tax=Polaribacter vadi TaxID=1774273 RepID=A0A1B8TYU4_9FLAO|nr:ketoacyl-ACP synthase III [Polaribacter vadi]AOW17237.1 3-oxoacyl-ACP synthase [Polaribacter vadi]OBY64836.1 3-oxoacyl-ACP synthase [Polaribacter vadi]
MGAYIKGIEYVYPEKSITNDVLLKEFPDYNFSKFENKVGIRTRYVVGENETALSLAIKAVNKLLHNNIDKSSIDFVLYCTQSPEYFLPTTACILQDACGLRTNIGALDFNLGCSGYTYGLSLAKGLINSGQTKNVLLVTAETYSKYIHKQDKSNRAIFGDAATATLISTSEEELLGDFSFGTDGSGAEKLIVKNGGSKFQYQVDPSLKEYGSDNNYTDNHLYMNGPEIFNFTSNAIPKFTESVLKLNNIEKNAVDQFIFHQANAFMLNFLRKRTKIDKNKFFIDLLDGGNTVSNTIPIALKKYSNLKNIAKSEKILLMGFGVGLSWCGGLVTINNKL